MFLVVVFSLRLYLSHHRLYTYITLYLLSSSHFITRINSLITQSIKFI